jgi:hypothetical protein
MRKINSIGQRFGRLTITAEAPSRQFPSRLTHYVVAVCDCGNSKEYAIASIRGGATTSCGCFRKEVTGDMSRSHGQSGTRLYRIWKGIHTRCNTPSASNYSYYGGKGITVCSDWDTFEEFSTWANSNGYREDLSIDRRDGNLAYSPANCRWATQHEQCVNRHYRR